MHYVPDETAMEDIQMTTNSDPAEIPQEVYELYDAYCHGDMSRRAFFSGLSFLRGFDARRLCDAGLRETANPAR